MAGIQQCFAYVWSLIPSLQWRKVKMPFFRHKGIATYRPKCHPQPRWCLAVEVIAVRKSTLPTKAHVERATIFKTLQVQLWGKYSPLWFRLWNLWSRCTLNPMLSVLTWTALITVLLEIRFFFSLLHPEVFLNLFFHNEAGTWEPQ